MELLLLHVTPPRPMPLSSAAAPGGYVLESARLRELAEAGPYLEKIAVELRAKGFSVRTLVERGDVAKVIVANASSFQADVIAMSTHGWTGLLHLLHGSVAEEVLRRSPVPVLAMRPARRES